MLNLKEREVEKEIQELYTWKRNYSMRIDKIVDIVKKKAPKAYENEEFQQSIKDLRITIEEYCAQKEKSIIEDLTDYTQKE